MKKSTKSIFAAVVTASVISCGGYAVYGPGPDVDNSDDYIEQIAKENSQTIISNEQ
ncbi:MAG: hypothetical protein IKP67_01555 [Spirochaetales bacterium]|nr:hypothetical protein [Spirochaetales bacterium]